MNRQYCILVYSANSARCKKLFEYIESLPFDILSTSGMALCCIDNIEIRRRIEICGVDSVPTLLTKYFDQKQQQLVGDEIYSWIAELAKRMGYKEDDYGKQLTIESPPMQQEIVSENVEELPIVQTKQRGSVMAEAMNMQKARDIQMGMNKKSE